jgi:rod shape-determining protein MreB and related proteins
MALFSKDLGIDLGTMNTRVAMGNEIIIDEPTMVAIAVQEQKIVEVGQEAQNMFGRVPESIEVARPLKMALLLIMKLPKGCWSI